MHMAGRQASARRSVQASVVGKTGSDLSLPALGNILPPMQPQALSSVSSGQGTDTLQGTVILPAGAPAATAIAAPSAQPAHVTALERRLSGAAFASVAAKDGSSGTTAGASSMASVIPEGQAPQQSDAKQNTQEALSPLLAADVRNVANARWMGSARMLLPKGAFIDCTLETAIDSSLPGLTTCLTATDTFGADGRVVLLERGTKLVGETRGQVQQGASRVFVLWTEARTPAGVIVPLDSPGADELGRSGLPGEVERHFWERFGAALLISTLDGAVQAAVQSTSRGGGTIVYTPSGPQDVASEVLKGTLNVPPTVIKRNGDRIQILVARDVDFGRVYELRHAGP
jgi:type IV secretion system protein VirB10